MTRVLFVDDERSVLDDLQDRLPTHSGDWDLRFVDDPFEVLPMLEADPAEVVVSDLAMPGMDGVSLLRVVKNRHPETIRIILSDRFDANATFELVGVAHQYLPKPCDPELLTDVIDRAVGLRRLLGDERLVRLVSGMSTLPSVPSLYTDIMRQVRSPDSSLADVATIIEQDTAMTAKVLQLVNSSFFGLRMKVTEARQAVTLLGLDNIVSLALGANIFTKSDHAEEAGLSIEHEQERAVFVAAGARKIADLEGLPEDQASAFFLAGFLHGVGTLILAENYPRRYRRDVSSLGDRRLAAKAEEAAFGAPHSIVGAYLLGVWGLPDGVIEAVAHHISPSRSAIRRFEPLAALHVASTLVDSYPDPPDLDMIYLDECGLTDRTDRWIDTVGEMLVQATDDDT